MRLLPRHDEALRCWRAYSTALAAGDRAELERLLARAREGARAANPKDRREWDRLVAAITRGLEEPKATPPDLPLIAIIALLPIVVAPFAASLLWGLAQEKERARYAFHAPEPTLERRTARAAQSPPSVEADVYVVPLGSLDRRAVERLVGSTGRQLGIRLVVLPAVSVAHVPPARKGQLPPWSCVYTVRSRSPGPAERWSAVIAVTELDLAGGVPTDRFTFTTSDLDVGAAVISLARLDPGNYGRPDASLLRARFRKLLVRSVGFLYFRSPEAADPSDPLRASIRSIDDVDAITPIVPRWDSGS